MPGIIRCDHSLSDHYDAFCVVKEYSFQSQKKTYYTIRDKTKFELNLFCEETSKVISQFEATLEELNETNFDNSFNAFAALLQKVMTNTLL